MSGEDKILMGILIACVVLIFAACGGVVFVLFAFGVSLLQA